MTKEGEVDYTDLSEYDGSKTGCDQCGRQFEEGEVISVVEGKAYVFCYTDSMAGCMIAHVAEASETMIGTSMRFGPISTSPQMT